MEGKDNQMKQRVNLTIPRHALIHNVHAHLQVAQNQFDFRLSILCFNADLLFHHKIVTVR